MFPTNKKPQSLQQQIERIRNESFYSFAEGDIHVPEKLRQKFQEMQPIFKNTEISREHLSEHMKEFAEENDFLQRPQRMLIGSMFGKKILLLSELASWYLKHGLVITRIYQMIEYTPRRCFEKFGESVCDARRMGDRDPDQELIATTSKLVGNSSYGKTIMDKEKHAKVEYVEGSHAASLRIRDNHFNSLEEIDEEFYEISMAKKKVRKKTDVFFI